VNEPCGSLRHHYSNWIITETLSFDWSSASERIPFRGDVTRGHVHMEDKENQAILKGDDIGCGFFLNGVANFDALKRDLGAVR